MDDDPESDLNVPSMYGIASEWGDELFASDADIYAFSNYFSFIIANTFPQYELSVDHLEVLWSIYLGILANMRRRRYLKEPGLMALKFDAKQGKRPRPSLAYLSSIKPRSLPPGSSEDA
ncbi:hypothetical protein Adt_29874 [Abeliophyllum distichum]|uniref:Uncharacterized protein n=1 Tax=Abeliophyllum distichum TaxID=126358 RepID=A0ABD1R9M1_9LAMI